MLKMPHINLLIYNAEAAQIAPLPLFFSVYIIELHRGGVSCIMTA